MAKSKSADICEKIIRTVILPKGKTMSEVQLKYRKLKGPKKYNLPLLMRMQEKVDDVISRDMRLFYMNVESTSDTLIVYLHGGAYVSEFLPFHWLMLDKITSSVDSTFIIPDYPLAPHSTYEDCFKKMEVFYRKVLEYYPDRRIIFMGDSAGGGLALALSIYFGELGLKVPEKLILLSPWVDLVMDNPEIKEYLKVDPLLKIKQLRADAASWANGSDLHDYKLSPIYGDFSKLKEVILFAGTHEFFYPDIRRLSELLSEAGIRNALYVGKDLPHVYPIYPTPEAEQALAIINRSIREM